MSEKKHTVLADIMTRGVITIEPTATVDKVVAIMAEKRMSSVVVERKDETDEFGIVTVRDIADGVLSKNLSPHRVNVYEIMTKPILTLAAEMNVVYAVRLLLEFGLNRAIVVDHDRIPQGIVTLRDMVLRSLKDENGGE